MCSPRWCNHTHSHQSRLQFLSGPADKRDVWRRLSSWDTKPFSWGKSTKSKRRGTSRLKREPSRTTSLLQIKRTHRPPTNTVGVMASRISQLVCSLESPGGFQPDQWNPTPCCKLAITSLTSYRHSFPGWRLLSVFPVPLADRCRRSQSMLLPRSLQQRAGVVMLHHSQASISTLIFYYKYINNHPAPLSVLLSSSSSHP